MIYSGRHSSIYFLITLIYCNLVRHAVESNLYSEFNNELDKVSNYAENRAKTETLATMGEIYDHNGELLRKHLQNIQFKDMRNANKLNRNAEIGKLINVLSPYHEPWPGTYPSSKMPLRGSRESSAQDSQYVCPTKHKTREIRKILPRGYKLGRFKKDAHTKNSVRYKHMKRKRRFGEKTFDPKSLLNTAPSEYPNVVANLLDVQKFNGMKNFAPLQITNEKDSGYSMSHIKEVQDALQQSAPSLFKTPSIGPDTGYEFKVRSVSMGSSPQEQNFQVPQQNNQAPQQNNQAPQQNNQTPQQNNQTPQQNNQAPQQSNQIPQQNNQAPQQNYQPYQQNNQTPQQNYQPCQQNSPIPPQNSQTIQQIPIVQPNLSQMQNPDLNRAQPQQIQNQDLNRSQSLQIQSPGTDLKGVLDQVLNELEGIKQCNNETDNAPDGFPCDVMGSWNSEMLGLRFDISSDVKGLNVYIRERTPSKRHTIMDVDWICNGGSLKKLGGPFYISAEKSEENKMALFSGLCKRCGGADTIFGSWTIINPSKNCEDVQMAIETRRDVFRRNELPRKKKERLERINEARSKES